jgi:uncharacterized membrane protein YfcA
MAEVHAVWMYPVLTVLGTAIGAYGALIGAGGGVLLVPVLLFTYPQESSNTIASISLAAVFFNTLSGTLAYGHMRRIDYRAGLLFAAAAAPGGILGAYVTSFLPRRVFELAFSVFVLALATFIFFHSTPKHRNPLTKRGETLHTLTDFQGTHYSYSFSNRRGILLSFPVACIASMLGMGGGAFYVPLLVYPLHFPLHIATATSLLILLIISPILSAAHVIAGKFTPDLLHMLFLGAGVLVGGQIGARLSQRMGGTILIRVLAGGLVVIGIRLAVHAFEK